MRKSNEQIRRELSFNMAGKYDMTQVRTVARRIEPQSEEEPSTVPDLLDGVVICMPDEAQRWR